MIVFQGIVKAILQGCELIFHFQWHRRILKFNLKYFNIKVMNLEKLYEIIRTSKYSNSHGSGDPRLFYAGLAPIYFSLIYSMISKKCVCLGSGDGFVPKLMVSAQSELIKEGLIPAYDVTLVDANLSGWGDRFYGDFIEGYPEINIVNEKTDDVVQSFDNISYLHIDADHSGEQVYKDLCNYGNRMQKNCWAITCHDTCHYNHTIEVYNSVKRWAKEMDHDLVNFPVGMGTALIMPKHYHKYGTDFFCYNLIKEE
jgi:hypothetical protein